MQDRSIQLFIFCVLVLGFLLGSYQQVWEQGAKKVTTTNLETLQKENNLYVQVIWDASGHMSIKKNSIQKMDKAKEFLSDLEGKLPPDVYLSLRIFGARKIDDLEDSFLAVPFAKNNQEIIKNYINNVEPLGKAVIGNSLKKAISDFDEIQGDKKILLITAGINQDYRSLQQIANNLNQKNIKLIIFHMGNENKQTLKNMAQITDGIYINKDNYNAFKNIFNK